MNRAGTEALGGAAAAKPGLVHHRIDDLESLRAALQTAVEIEFTVIPAYLSALFTIKDRSSPAFQTLRSVVVEEMFHVNQAANLLIGVGGKPRFTGKAVPVYPCHPPAADNLAMPWVGLYRASPMVFREVFMRLEAPAPYNAASEGENYTSIGQFYNALEDGLETCVEKLGAASVFQQSPSLRQRSDIYIGKFGGRAIEVRDLAGARQAILEIKQQGEGAVDPIRTMAPLEPWGGYNHYGTRQDGSYGPILGTPFELSHYFRFKRIVDSGIFPDVYPSLSNPRLVDFTNPVARRLAIAFNEYYSVMLLSLERAFEVGPPNRDVYLEITLPVMHNFLPRIAELLVTSPAIEEGDPTVGPNAAPTFEYYEGARFHEIFRIAQSLSTQSGSGKESRPSDADGREKLDAVHHLLGDLCRFRLMVEDEAFEF
jgi:hypothetical protein